MCNRGGWKAYRTHSSFDVHEMAHHPKFGLLADGAPQREIYELIATIEFVAPKTVMMKTNTIDGGNLFLSVTIMKTPGTLGYSKRYGLRLYPW